MVYFLFFGAIVVSSMIDNFSSYPRWLAVSFAVSYPIAMVGVLLHALRRSLFGKPFWVVFFFLFIIHFIAEGSLDASKVQTILPFFILVWGVGFLFFLPAFNAIYYLGFGMGLWAGLKNIWPLKNAARPVSGHSSKRFPQWAGVLPLILATLFMIHLSGLWVIRILAVKTVLIYHQDHRKYPEKMSDSLPLNLPGIQYEHTKD
ncbi:MAG: hypothetical protein WC530_09800 [Candidatus Omnitrophota bacterium]